jgi:hypothetical protein
MTVEPTLSPADVAALLGGEEHSAAWVKRVVNAGSYEYLRVGRSMRFTVEQADAFIRSFTVRPDGGSPAPEKDELRSQTGRSKNRTKTAA